MSILHVLILAALSFVVFVFCVFPKTRKVRPPLLLIISSAVIYWLQPALAIRGLDFWLPTATLSLTVLGWILTSRSEERKWRATLTSIGLVVSTVLAITLTRYFSSSGILTPSRPPQIFLVLIVLLAVIVILSAVSRVKRFQGALLGTAVVLLLLIFIVLKFPLITLAASAALRSWAGQSAQMASSLDLRWLGFSYVAFRLLHTLRDRQTGRLPAMTLEEYITYVLFFPAISAGPIDKSDRFLRDLRRPFLPDPEQVGFASKRIVMGLFKKFVVADLLALVSLNPTNATQVLHSPWMWVLLYAYSFQIFFDFSGYTDIAIGLAALMGIHLPENFNAPYLKNNLTQFWNHWHITLTQWFRTYFFNPFTRTLRSRAKSIPLWVVLLLAQLSTMILIGLWHGFTINFFLWGCWHGLGLFIQNRWSDWTQPLAVRLEKNRGLRISIRTISTLLTFQFVALGWVWFAMPSVELSVRVFARLFGAGA
ncbi:MAG: hypothetical protein NTZ74_10880 [Chloroflexi bacterium]|nr:hypothetical protein [Chloroflexota bacterium]